MNCLLLEFNSIQIRYLIIKSSNIDKVLNLKIKGSSLLVVYLVNFVVDRDWNRMNHIRLFHHFIGSHDV